MKTGIAIGILLTVFMLGAAGFAVAAGDTDDPITDVQKTVRGIQSVFGGNTEKDTVSEGQAVGTEATEPSGSGRTAQALKEALMVGIEAAVNQAGVEGGFYQNPDIRILLPENLRTADAVVRQLGGEDLSDTLVLKMNRAAEKAAPEAEAIFVSAIQSITINDAREILTGEDTAATRYLEDNTSDSLKESFLPIVKSTMEEIGVIKTYHDYIGKYQSNPLMKMVDLDLNRYVTDETIDGLFLMVAEEERKIRENPAARVTDLLKSVFGKAGE